MPERYPPPGKYRVRDYLGKDRVMVVKCGGCHRIVRYLVEDIAAIKGGDWDITCPPYPCSTCGTRDAMGVFLKEATKADVGVMEIRRPWKVVTIQKWMTVKLGEPVD